MEENRKIFHERFQRVMFNLNDHQSTLTQIDSDLVVIKEQHDFNEVVYRPKIEEVQKVIEIQKVARWQNQQALEGKANKVTKKLGIFGDKFGYLLQKYKEIDYALQM